MIKKMVLSGLCGMMSMTAFAAYPADYFGLPEVTTSGFYINGQIGWGRVKIAEGTNTGTLNIDGLTILPGDVTFSSQTENNVAGRLAFGYYFNPFFGLELGGSAWAPSDTNLDQIESVTLSTGGSILVGNATGKINHSHYAVDLLGKIDVSIYRDLHAFVKAGAAYVFSNVELDNLVFVTTVAPVVSYRIHNFNRNNNYFAPEAAAGLGYQINPNWDVSLNYSRIFGRGNNSFSSNYKPALDMATLGVEWDI